MFLFLFCIFIFLLYFVFLTFFAFIRVFRRFKWIVVISQLPAVDSIGGAFIWLRHAVHTVRPRLSAMDAGFLEPIAPPPVAGGEVQVPLQVNTPSPKRRRHSTKGPDPNQTPPAPALPPPVLPTHPEICCTAPAPHHGFVSLRPGSGLWKTVRRRQKWGSQG